MLALLGNDGKLKKWSIVGERRSLEVCLVPCPFLVLSTS
jgi:hypothetical protein